jgi:hypothetical protein
VNSVFGFNVTYFKSVVLRFLELYCIRPIVVLQIRNFVQYIHLFSVSPLKRKHMCVICGVSKSFGEWYQKTNKLTWLAFKIIAILYNTLLATFIKLWKLSAKASFGIDRRTNRCHTLLDWRRVAAIQQRVKVCLESHYALRLRYVDLVESTEVVVEVCCCFTVFSCHLPDFHKTRSWRLTNIYNERL